MQSTLKRIPPPDPRPFNPWRSFTDEAQPFVDVVLSLLASYETSRRARKAPDQVRYRKIVTAMVSDVAYHCLRHESGGIQILTCPL